MTTYYPISLVPIQYVDSTGNPYSGAVLKAYSVGTTTPMSMATTYTGTLVSSVTLNASGYPAVSGNVVIPHFLSNYKLALYPTQADADLDTGAIWTVDNNQLFTTSTVSTFFQKFSGTGAQTAFTLSSDMGTDEKALMVFVSGGLREHSTNGTFASDTGWTKGAGWTIAAGVATATGAISTALEQSAAITLVAGMSYTVTYTVTRSAGGVIASVGGTSGTERTANGTYTETIIAGATQVLAFTGNAFTGTVDTVTVKPTTAIGFEPKDPTVDYTVSGTTLTFVTAPDSGTNNIWVFSPSTFIGAAEASAAAAAASASAAATSATNAATSATNAATSATNAATSATSSATSATASATSATSSANSATAAASSATAAAASAVLAGSALYSTSTTSVAIGTGLKTFTTQSGKNYFAGQFISAASNALATNYMHGQVDSYSGTTLVINVADVGGSGTYNDWNIAVSGTSTGGTVTSVSVTTANGVSGTVANATSTPAITISLGAITPSSVNSIVLSGSATPTLSVTGTTSVSGTNTGDQTNITGNAATVTVADAAGDTTTWPLLGTSQTGNLAPATDAGLTYDATTNTLTTTTFVGALTGTASGNLTSGGALGTPSSGTLTNCTGLPVAGGGTGAATLAAHGVLIGNGTGAVAVTGAGTAGQVLTSNGAAADPTFQAAAAAGGLIGPGHVAGNYYGHVLSAYNYSAVAIPAGKMIAMPTYIANTVTITKLSIDVTTLEAGKSARIGIYNTANGGPTTLVLDAGTVSVATTGVKEITGLSQVLTAGNWYAFVVLSDATGTAAIYSSGSVVNGITGVTSWGTSSDAWQVTQAYGALPANFGTASLLVQGPTVFYRV